MALFLKIHRWLAMLGVLVVLYLGVTGSLIQLTDLRSILGNVSPYDHNIMAMREDTNGPSNYAVIGPEDYLAVPLPATVDPVALLASVNTAARARLGAIPLSYVELRMRGGQPVGVVGAQGKILSFDAHSGAFLTSSDAPPFDEAYKRQSFRNTVKHLHRMTSFGDWALWINMTAAVILIVLIVTGTLIYLRQHKSRRDMGRPALFWTTSGGWRMLHRWISAGMAIFMAVVVLSGSWLTLESLGIAINGPKYFITTPSGDKMPSLFDPRLTTPLPDAMVGPMAVATLNNYHAAMPKIGLRAIRLRNYAGYAQGVVISGEAEPQQLVFDTKTGRRLSLTEPGYPEVGLPLGWQVHQWAKFIHRGEAFGLSGRMMSLLSGFAMIYLSISGIVMYWELWNRRRKAGKTAVFW